MDLFNQVSAHFSPDRKYRYSLTRKWDASKPLILWIGLNPSKASEFTTDTTIRCVRAISNHNGYGGFYMTNCFPYISTDPEKLRDFNNTQYNDEVLRELAAQCKDVVFAWGAFKIVKELGRDQELMKMFPRALCLDINSDGSPKHPRFAKYTSKLIPFCLKDEKGRYDNAAGSGDETSAEGLTIHSNEVLKKKR